MFMRKDFIESTQYQIEGIQRQLNAVIKGLGINVYEHSQTAGIDTVGYMGKLFDRLDSKYRTLYIELKADHDLLLEHLGLEIVTLPTIKAVRKVKK